MFKKLKPGQLLILSYGLVSLIGTILLMLPSASIQQGSASFIHAWFTATSALTVTGLTVVSTNTYWTIFGQSVILILIQVGGLGLMVFTTVFFIVLGMKVQLSQKFLVAQDRNSNFIGILKLVRSIVFLSLILEGIGALLMGFLLPPDIWDDGIFKGIFFIVFHAISAFNGAGFDLTGQSLTPYRYNIGFNVIVIILILLGSLGYVVLQDLIVLRNWQRPSLHSRLVLWVTGIIAIIGSVFYFLTEYNYSLLPLTLSNKIVESIFQAVTRTAGFITVPVSTWSEPFTFLMILMMFIGASPGSVGGGIKTTTIGVILLAVWSIARGKKELVVQKREIALESVLKAFTVTIIALIIVVLCTLILMVVEKISFMPVLFEVVSASATVGLTLGVTEQLSTFGKVLIIILMFIGRIGPLSLMIFLTNKKRRHIRYLKEKIFIG